MPETYRQHIRLLIGGNGTANLKFSHTERCIDTLKEQPMKILILAGGLSAERDVSLTSGCLIAAALIERGHKVCLCDPYTGLDPNGQKPCYTDTAICPHGISKQVPDLEELMRSSGRGERRIAPGVMELCRMADTVFIALHGDVGEDGRLQAMLEMENIRHTGSGYVGCLLSMNKDITKRLLRDASVLTPDWVCCSLSKQTTAAAAEQIEWEIGYPCVVKPCCGGSSIGVSMAENRAQLMQALTLARRFEGDIVAERRIQGRDVTVSILGGRVLPAIEILPHSGFYDYSNKYQAGASDEICPADISEAASRSMAEAVKRGFEVLHLGGYARFDFILDETDKAWCLEANALPGMTATSLLPRAAAAVGMDYPSLCEEILKLADKPEGNQPWS